MNKADTFLEIDRRMHDKISAWAMAKWLYRRNYSRSKYRPHQGWKEMERRRNQFNLEG